MIAIRLLCIVAASDDRFADLLALRRPHKEILCVFIWLKPERVLTAGCSEARTGRQGGLPVRVPLAGARTGPQTATWDRESGDT